MMHQVHQEVWPLAAHRPLAAHHCLVGGVAAAAAFALMVIFVSPVVSCPPHSSFAVPFPSTDLYFTRYSPGPAIARLSPKPTVAAASLNTTVTCPTVRRSFDWSRWR